MRCGATAVRAPRPEHRAGPAGGRRRRGSGPAARSAEAGDGRAAPVKLHSRRRRWQSPVVAVRCDTDPVTTAGTVREWHTDEGWGVIDSDATPGGCWAGFGSVLMSGYRSLAAGQPVSFEFEAGRQDGYDYRAVAVWTGDDRPAAPARPQSSTAYYSVLHLSFDAPPDGEATDPVDRPR